MKKIISGVGFSLLSPLIVGLGLGIYFSIISGQSSALFSMLLSAIANAHIVGLTMALIVLPGYITMQRFQCIHYSGVLTLGLLGGALFSFLFAASSGGGFIVNVIMSAIAAGLFLFGLRIGAEKLSK
ncbi:hypothetical protein ACSLBF_07470 [Pseudoalteromonas sp. T1lg65]|uniref:hypothetical protein n=1 Tax=Pseudoalteromonas sp. T1lg65 TaxID=2077101 RepID=UPI003F792471